MKNIEVIEQFIKNKVANTQNLTSTGEFLYSYNTCIAQKKGNKYYINNTKYSSTTSKHRNMLMCQLFPEQIILINDVPINTKNLVRWIEQNDKN